MAKKKILRPLIITEPPPDDFGEYKGTADFHERADADLTYVPGYSEIRLRRDRELSEMAQGKIRPAEVSTLPVALRWERVQNKLGTPDARELLSAVRQGYRAALKSDIGAEWLRELPPAATVAADGTIRQGDVQLLVTDQAHAARNLAEQRRRTEAQVRGTRSAFEDIAPGAFIEESTERKK